MRAAGGIAVATLDGSPVAAEHPQPEVAVFQTGRGERYRLTPLDSPGTPPVRLFIVIFIDRPKG